MRRRVGTALAAGAVAALAFTAAPAGAQEGPATLGFEVDRTEGRPGEQVNGEVDVADVAAHCATDVASLQARFAEVVAGPFNGLNLDGELFRRFYPSGEVIIETHDQLAFSLTGIVLAAVAENFDGAADRALPETFVMTFADIATQEPTGTRGTFDPTTGDGSVLVPDLEPGFWAVAAACVSPMLDIDGLEAGIRESGAHLEQLGMPADPVSPEFEEWVKDFLDDEDATLFEFLAAIGPDLIEPIATPDAMGFQIFCVYDGATTCEEPPPAGPPGTTPPGEGPPAGDAPPATPVRAQPSFTG